MQINTLRLRATLGWLGMLLPWIVLISCYVFGYGFPDSISATYHLPPTVTPFMIILGASGLLLICYKGYDKHDDLICTLAGIAALGICLFPCGTRGLATHWSTFIFPQNVGTFQLPANISGFLHNACALSFFALLSYNSLFLFTKGDDIQTLNKQRRNVIYRVCGIGMMLSFLMIIPISIFKLWGGIWTVEAIALMFFGISWLTKADIYPWLFCDTPYTD